MIIDIHGHYTTAPKALEAWRKRQVAGIGDAAAMPKVRSFASATTNCASRSRPTSCASCASAAST